MLYDRTLYLYLYTAIRMSISGTFKLGGRVRGDNEQVELLFGLTFLYISIFFSLLIENPRGSAQKAVCQAPQQTLHATNDLVHKSCGMKTNIKRRKCFGYGTDTQSRSAASSEEQWELSVPPFPTHDALSPFPLS